MRRKIFIERKRTPVNMGLHSFFSLNVIVHYDKIRCLVDQDNQEVGLGWATVLTFLRSESSVRINAMGQIQQTEYIESREKWPIIQNTLNT